jgi:metal-responsive CopG/Arc/MetJ family transcriptional regulator
MDYANKNVIRKKGRPATGQDKPIAFRLPEELVARVDVHAAAKGQNRSAAVRDLLEDGLAAHARKRKSKT